MIRWGTAIMLGLSVACVRYEDHFLETYDVGVTQTVMVDSERGDFDYIGSGRSTFDVDVVSWGNAGAQDVAARNEEGNEWSVVMGGGQMQLNASTAYARAGIDFTIDGPLIMDHDVFVESGRVHLEGVEGYQVVSASRFTSTQWIGAGEIYTTGSGADVDLWPWVGSDTLIDSVGGDVVLRLPWGGGYNIEVWGDPAYPMVIADLGFDQSVMADGYFAAERSPADAQIHVYVTGGTFELRESF